MSDKYSAFTFLSIGVVLTISSLFIFAIGWDKLKSFLESGSVNGQVEVSLANSPFHLNVKVSLLELDGNIIAVTGVDEKGKFDFVEIAPGNYQIYLNGRGLRPIKKTITVFPKRSTEVGLVPMEFEILALGEKEDIPPYRYADVLKDYNGDLWAVGFQSKDKRSVYKVLKKSGDSWSEIIIPQFKGAIQAISVNSLGGDAVLIGSAGNGAAILRNGSQSWELLELGSDIWGLKDAIELPDKSWIVAAVGGKKYQYSTGVILKSKDKGSSWQRVIEIEDEINNVMQLTSGRLLFSTTSLKSGACIYYSDDFGESWEKTTISTNYKLRGIKDILETKAGVLYAGVMDGANWKGGFLKGGLILRSDDNGLSWEEFYLDSKWRGVNAIYENDKKHLFVWAGSDIYVTFDEGAKWIFFSKAVSGYARTLIGHHSDELYIIGSQAVYRFESSIFNPTIFNKHIRQTQ